MTEEQLQLVQISNQQLEQRAKDIEQIATSITQVCLLVLFRPGTGKKGGGEKAGVSGVIVSDGVVVLGMGAGVLGFVHVRSSCCFVQVSHFSVDVNPSPLFHAGHF